MTIRRMSAVAGAGLLAVGLSAQAQGGGQRPGEVLHLQVANDQFDVADVGAPGTSLGDRFVYSDNLLRGGAVVGQDGGVCEVVKIVGERVITNCVLSLELTDGQITAQGLWERGTTPLHMAITGGTGAYAGIRGILVARDIQTEKESYAITFDR